ncbi:hypothetical protein AMS68_000737 [Peltaster fructicola]|uniref:Uncharacterized protein n=1 Tax=Peltaster fructicola TaxID=286661 RepID=A0A6H0XL44_9PEZI|nr:hypothetical protein AMS68_000737 [Peltaster fructicola]
MSFLSSIEAHLDKNDTDDTIGEVREPRHTQDDEKSGRERTLDEKAALSSTNLSQDVPELNRKAANVEEQGDRERQPEVEGDPAVSYTSVASWADLEEPHSQPASNWVRDAQAEDKLSVSGSEAWEVGRFSVTETSAERLDAAPSLSLTAREQDAAQQAVSSSFAKQANTRINLAAILEADKTDVVSDGTGSLENNIFDDETATAEIGKNNTRTTPQHNYPALHPTAEADIAQESIQRSRYDHLEIPRIPAQIMSEEYKAGVDDRNAQLAEMKGKWQQFLRTRHDFDGFAQAKEWSTAWSYLKALTPKGLSAHSRQTEHYSLPAGVKLRWLADRGSAMAEIMLNTYSLFQVDKHDLETDTFEAFSFQGTPAQNAAARHFIFGRTYFEIVRGEAATGPCPTLEDLMSETHRAPLQTLDDHSPDRSVAINALDRLREPWVEATANDAEVPRVFWNSGGYKHVALLPIVRAAYSRVILEPLELNAAVDFLTAAWPRRELHKVATKYKESAVLVIARALARLLTTPANVAVTPSATLHTAWHWLRRTRQLPELRQIQSAHDELAASGSSSAVRATGTSAYNELLCYSALHSNVHMFRYTLKCMEDRSIGTDAVSWEHFFVLTQHLFPDKTDAVLDEMHTLGVLGNAQARKTVVAWYVRKSLLESLAAFRQGIKLPADYIESLLESVSERLTTKKWMNPWLAKEMAALLLDRGHWYEAWQIAEYMPLTGRRFDSALLTVFLRAAQGHAELNAVMAVEIIQRFSNFLKHQQRRPAGEEANLVQKPRPKTIIWNAIVYGKLLDIAVREHCWNLARVIWQHACCTDNASYAVQKRIKDSLQMYNGMTMAQNDTDVSSEQFWQASWAAYAIGVGQKSSLVRDADNNPWQSPKQRAEAATARWHSDVTASGTVWPINSLLEDAEAALKLDLTWQKQYQELFKMDDKRMSFQERLDRMEHLVGDLSSQAILVPVESLQSTTDHHVVGHGR